MKLVSVLVSLLGLVAADTMKVDLHVNDCQDAAFQSFTIGTVNSCHNADQEFKAFVQHDIQPGLFGRKLGIQVFSGRDCTGGSAHNSLSNERGCVGNGGNSFKLGPF